MHITILGSGCANCRTLEKNTRDAVDALGIDATFDHVTDPADIAGWGVMRTPALAIDDTLVLSGRVPTSQSVKELLERHL